jgi:hypothetical protein
MICRVCASSGPNGGLDADGDILQRGLPGKQRVGLEQVAGQAVEVREARAENFDPAGGWRKQPGGDVEQRRLAAAGRADDRNEFAIRDLERGTLHRGIAAAAGQPEVDTHIGERDRRRGIRLRPRAVGALAHRVPLPAAASLAGFLAG